MSLSHFSFGSWAHFMKLAECRLLFKISIQVFESQETRRHAWCSWSTNEVWQVVIFEAQHYVRFSETHCTAKPSPVRHVNGSGPKYIQHKQRPVQQCLFWGEGTGKTQSQAKKSFENKAIIIKDSSRKSTNQKSIEHKGQGQEQWCIRTYMCKTGEDHWTNTLLININNNNYFNFIYMYIKGMYRALVLIRRWCTVTIFKMVDCIQAKTQILQYGKRACHFSFLLLALWWLFDSLSILPQLYVTDMPHEHWSLVGLMLRHEKE